MQTGMVGAAFVAGLLSFFSPCILPLLPVYIGLLTTDAGNNELGPVRRAANTVAFVLGISVTFLILGLGAGAVGRALNNGYIAIACGLIIFVFGLHLSGFARISLLDREKRLDTSKLNASTVIGAFLLGLGFSFGWTPCIGPILGSVLALAAQQGTALEGALLTLVYSLGMSIPFLVITLASNLLISRVRKLNKYLPVIQRIGGALIAIMGLWMIFSQVHEYEASAPSISAEVVAEQTASESSSESSSDSAAANSTDSAAAESSSSAEASTTAGSDEGSDDDLWRNLEFKDIEGQTHTFAEWEGKPLYIEFWGTWCPQCMDNMDEFRQTAIKHNEAQDVQVVSVASPGHFGEKDEAELIDWCHDEGLEFPVLMDPNADLVSYFGLTGFPTSVFVDANGKVQLVRAGVIEPDELEGLFETLAKM